MAIEKLKAWITTKALTEGIQLVDAEIHDEISAEMVVYRCNLQSDQKNG